MIHLCREQRESGSRDAPDQCISSDAGICIHQVTVDDVIDALQEDHENAHPDRDAGQDLRDPCNVWGTRPGKPKEAGWQHKGANDHWWETLFRDEAALLLHLACEARLGDVGHDNGTHDHADGEGEEGERANAEIPAAFFLEGDWICFEEEIQDAVDESHVESNEEEDGFLDQHLEWTEEVAGHDVREPGLPFIDLGMECPVPGLVPEGFGAAGENDWCVCFRDKDYGAKERGGGHEEGDPLRPAPTEVGLGDEAADNRT